MKSLSCLCMVISFLMIQQFIHMENAYAEQNLTIFYSNDLLGETEPCG